jgi:hypothetical protein
MKALRRAAIVVGSVVILYLILIVFLPQWMIVGIHIRWPWK